MSTNFETNMSFTLPEFSDKKIITWKFDVGEDKNLGDYDMIIGRDIQWALKMIIDFKTAHLKWDDIAIPMRDYQKIKKYNFSRKELRMIIQEFPEPLVTEKATQRMIKILDQTIKQQI